MINLPPLYAQHNLHWHKPINFSFFSFPAFHILARFLSLYFFKHSQSNESNHPFERNFNGSLIIMTAAVIAVTRKCTEILCGGALVHTLVFHIMRHACWKVLQLIVFNLKKLFALKASPYRRSEWEDKRRA